METPAGGFVLFDFDGVIADSFSLAFDVARIVHPEAKLTPEKYKEWFEGNVYESIHRSGQEGRSEQYFAAFAPRMEREVSLVRGMDAVVKKIAASRSLVIVSSTTTPYIRTFLSRHGLEDFFREVLGSDVHTSKVEKIRMVFERYGVRADGCVFVTDTLGDMKEANEHSIGAIGVSWGWHSRETLEKGLPFRIVEAPGQLPDAVDDYFARGTL